MSRALVIVALAVIGACRVAELDYEGKQCPCPSGWDCNLASYTCTRAPGSGSGDGGPGDGVLGDGGNVPGVSCLPNPRTTLIYSSVGFSDFPSGWLQAFGQWSHDGNEVRSTNSANTLAWLSHAVPTSSGASDYRVVATMRYIDSTEGGSVGIGFRIGQQATMYTCTFDPVAGEFDLIYTSQGVDAPLQRKSLNVIGAPTAAFTMEIMTSQNSHTCCLRGYESSTLTMPAGFLDSGNPGVVTRNAEGGFTSFYVYE